MKLLFAGRTREASRDVIASMRKARIACEFAGTGAEALDLLRPVEFNLVLLGLDLPDMTGFGLVRSLRGEGRQVPAIILSGSSAPHVRANALAAGANDVLVRPFDPGELVARVRAAVRRSRGQGTGRLEAGPLRLDTEAHQLSAGGRAVPLTRKEYDVLELLMLRKGQLMTKEALLSQLYGGMDEPGIKIIDVFVCKLRKKLARVGAEHMISTVWGRGYVLLTPVDDPGPGVTETLAAAG